MPAALVCGLGVWLETSWPLGGLVTALIVGGLPWLVSPRSASARQIEQLEAVEGWVRQLSDMHTVGVSLEQSIQSSLRSTPPAIREDVGQLVARLSAGWQPQRAYRAFADSLDDAATDEVVGLFLLHAEDRGHGLSGALSSLAQAVQDETRMRRDADAEQEKPRTNDRWVTGFCLGIFGLSALSATYVHPYTQPAGQLFVAVLGVCFIAVKLWMRRLSAVAPTPRFLQSADVTTDGEAV